MYCFCSICYHRSYCLKGINVSRQLSMICYRQTLLFIRNWAAVSLGTWRIRCCQVSSHRYYVKLFYRFLLLNDGFILLSLFSPREKHLQALESNAIKYIYYLLLIFLYIKISESLHLQFTE